jgi:hypothetical protein
VKRKGKKKGGKGKEGREGKTISYTFNSTIFCV